jgi:hypothetical protein
MPTPNELALIKRLRESLPTMDDGPDHMTWCSVLGSDLRAAIAALEASPAAPGAAQAAGEVPSTAFAHENEPNAPEWLLSVETATRIGNEHRIRIGAIQSIAKAVHDLYSKRTPPPAAPSDGEVPSLAAVRDAIATSLGNTAYFCTRVWDAWSVGTMSQDDFTPVVECEEALLDMARAAVAAERAGRNHG